MAGIVLAAGCHAPAVVTPPPQPPPVVVEVPPPPPPEPVVELPRLVPSGNFFRLATGEHLTLIQASGFTLYQHFLDGGREAVEPVLQQLEDIGFNAARVFGMYNNPPTPTAQDPGRGGIGHFIPADYGERYWTQLPAFYQRLAAHHLYGEFVAFADTSQIPLDQLAHWARLVTTLQPLTNSLLEAVNEADQAMNRLDSLAQLPRPVGVLASHGSNGSQTWPVQPYWDYVTFHTNDAPEESRKVGHNCMEIWAGPCLTNETTRDGKGAWFAHPEDVSAGAALLAGGSCYHSNAGKAGRLLEAAELEHARAWVAGARSVPPTCDGPYRHRQDLEGPTDLRVYQRGADAACLVRIRR